MAVPPHPEPPQQTAPPAGALKTPLRSARARDACEEPAWPPRELPLPPGVLHARHLCPWTHCSHRLTAVTPRVGHRPGTGLSAVPISSSTAVDMTHKLASSAGVCHCTVIMPEPEPEICSCMLCSFKQWSWPWAYSGLGPVEYCLTSQSS